MHEMNDQFGDPGGNGLPLVLLVIVVVGLGISLAVIGKETPEPKVKKFVSPGDEGEGEGPAGQPPPKAPVIDKPTKIPEGHIPAEELKTDLKTRLDELLEIGVDKITNGDGDPIAAPTTGPRGGPYLYVLYLLDLAAFHRVKGEHQKAESAEKQANTVIANLMMREGSMMIDADGISGYHSAYSVWISLVILSFGNEEQWRGEDSNGHRILQLVLEASKRWRDQWESGSMQPLDYMDASILQLGMYALISLYLNPDRAGGFVGEAIDAPVNTPPGDNKVSAADRKVVQLATSLADFADKLYPQGGVAAHKNSPGMPYRTGWQDSPTLLGSKVMYFLCRALVDYENGREARCLAEIKQAWEVVAAIDAGLDQGKEVIKDPYSTAYLMRALTLLIRFEISRAQEGKSVNKSVLMGVGTAKKVMKRLVDMKPRVHAFYKPIAILVFQHEIGLAIKDLGRKAEPATAPGQEPEEDGSQSQGEQEPH